MQHPPLESRKQSRRFMLTGALAGSAAAFSGQAYAQDGRRVLEGLLGAASNRRGASLNPADADAGLREALINGAIASALRLGRVDGYWGDQTVRIPLPGSVGSLQRRLRPIGLSAPLDDLQLKINRGAETAAPMAVDIFRDAIRGLTITDAVQVVRGGPTAATTLLDTRTRPQLTEIFTPPVRGGMDQSGASQALDGVEARYGRQLGSASAIFGRSQTASGSLKDQFVGFAVGKALDGLFRYVGEEERAIRSDPARRSSELLRRVFGG
ncbi:MAG: DUF4197 domain-containing protein [Hyphomonadaceae bacterium]|jgi:hypothetical protein|nr:DUF4197 domain-containing protein [Hyphomonadaceae bacterium]